MYRCCSRPLYIIIYKLSFFRIRFMWKIVRIYSHIICLLKYSLNFHVWIFLHTRNCTKLIFTFTWSNTFLFFQWTIIFGRIFCWQQFLLFFLLCLLCLGFLFLFLKFPEQSFMNRLYLTLFQLIITQYFVTINLII